MEVLLAVETMSNSVADIIQQLCEEDYEDFIDCESTVKFLRLNNNLFDVQNYGIGKKNDDHFKHPLNSTNIGKFEELFHEYGEFTSKVIIDEYTFKK